MIQRVGWALVAVSLWAAGCGQATVDLTGASYVPKIVIDGTLTPGRPVDDILITRNMPINASVEFDTLPLETAIVTITDGTGRVFPLFFDAPFFETGSISVLYGETYRLDVSAAIDGRVLTAWATTQVPAQGFTVLVPKSRLDTLSYRQRDSAGNVINFFVTFQRSTGNEFYALSVTALNADTGTYIYDNSFYDFTAQDVIENFHELKYGYNWMQNAPPEPGESRLEVYWFHLNFYGSYRLIVYAGDKNFRDFFVTQENVQEIDGNFHEPTMHVEGDGIGVFGSALADTVFFYVSR